MADVFTTLSSNEPVSMPAKPEPIRPASGTLAATKASAAADPAVIRLFVNDERNSRLARPLGGSQTAWAVRWKVELSAMSRPSELLAAGDRIVVRGGSLWLLLGGNGRELGMGRAANSLITLDPLHGLLFAADDSGQLDGYRLGDGQLAFRLALRFLQDHARLFVARRDARLIAVSRELTRDSNEPPPEKTMIEMLRLADPPKSWNEPGGSRVARDLQRESYTMVVAMHGDSIAAATNDGVYLLDADLQVRRALTGSFLPLEMSLDEAGRIYLLVEAQGQTALWMMSPQGERWYSFAFPPGVRGVIRPPIVGYDHTAYIVTADRILSVAPDGKLNWMRSAAGAIAGAAVTADDVLLVSEGNALTAWDAQGLRRVLYEFRGETPATAPAVTDDGDLLVATGTAVYRLTRAKP